MKAGTTDKLLQWGRGLSTAERAIAQLVARQRPRIAFASGSGKARLGERLVTWWLFATCCLATGCGVRAVPGISAPPGRSQPGLAKKVVMGRFDLNHRVTKTGYVCISPVSTRASNRV